VDLEARTEAVRARLATVPNLNVFVGEPVAVMDSDNKAHPYAAIYPTPGWHDPTDATLDESRDLLSWTFQVTAAGGDSVRCTRAASRVLGVLLGWRLEPSAGPVRLEFNPGPMQIDRDVQPFRTYLPLMFTAPLANTPV
jgi:hypothetical protein